MLTVISDMESKRFDDLTAKTSAVRDSPGWGAAAPERIHMRRSARLATLTAALLAASLAVAACGTNGGSTGATGGDGKTLKLWHYEAANSAMGIAWNAAIKEFKVEHPGVTVKFEAKSFEQIQKSASLILNSNSVPDVMEYNKGNATAGILSKQGLLTDLTSFAKKNGWDKSLSAGIQTTAKYDGEGLMGSGKWYGVPNYGEYVEVFYNKDMFAKSGVQVPTTLAEFEQALATFKSKGITPISNAGAEYPAQQILYELALSHADRSWVNDYERYTKPVDFHGPAFTFAADTMSDWVKKGYIAQNSAGVKAENMGVAWEQAKFPIMISGSWWYGRFVSEIKDFQWGTFLFPGNTLNAGSSGNLWVVPAKAKNKTLAEDFIKITMSKKIQNIMGNKGGIPVLADPSAITDAKSKELIANFNKLNDTDGLAFYPDWPAPGYYDVMVAGVQKLINGTAPSSVLDDLAKPYNDNLKTIGKS
jgi:raffinose/stachyose/melibiose transport system substrate-binding protein